MKTETRSFYTCAVCGKVSTSQDKIQKCEESHITFGDDVILRAEYRRGKEYPISVEFEMPDGTCVEYYFNLTRKKAQS